MQRYFLGVFLLSLWLPNGLAQTPSVAQREIRLTFDSGEITNDHHEWHIAFSEMVEVPDATWLRLYFESAILGRSAEGKGALLRVTSVADGASQTMNATHIKQWGRSTAYFNGDAVLVEILAEPGMTASRIRLEKVIAGERPENEFFSICGPTDDRELSTDPRAARLQPLGCTVFMINDQNQCFLTSVICLGDFSDVAQFNVPLSLPDGSIQHPPPEDQYALDPLSFQTSNTGIIGDDFAYFGCFPNTNTNLTAAEAQGGTYIMGTPPTDPTGQNIRVTGYGTSETPQEWNQAQKTHVAPLIFINPTVIQHLVDTTGGNNGAPIIHEETGHLIGVHTHGGCVSNVGNFGTNILYGPLQAAIANPKGVCKPPARLAFSLPSGRPTTFPVSGGNLEVQVAGANGGTPQTGTGMFLYDLEDGSGIQTVPMKEISPNLYRAQVPAAPCGSRIIFDFSAETQDGQTYTALEDTLTQRFIAEYADERVNNFADDFESDMGWTVENSADLEDGAWERGVPAGGGVRQDPPFDADGSGSCFLTDNVVGNSDVDTGNTVLVSPIMDATKGDAHISYRRWFFNSNIGSGDDVMLVEVSNNGGADWQTLETLGPTGPDTEGGWIQKSFRIAEIFPVTAQFRIRFDVSDLGTSSTVEAGIDDVRMNLSELGFFCKPCRGDVNDDGVVDQTDIDLMVEAWGSPIIIDLNGDGNLDIRDIILALDELGACP